MIRHILVPTDFGAPSDGAIDLAVAIALRFEGRLTLLHVASKPPPYYYASVGGLAFPIDRIETEAKAMLDRALETTKARCPSTESLLVTGAPWEQILEAIQSCGADLVVMGTHGRRGVRRMFLGSVAEKIVRHSPVPVMTTPGPAPLEAPRPSASRNPGT